MADKLYHGFERTIIRTTRGHVHTAPKFSYPVKLRYQWLAVDLGSTVCIMYLKPISEAVEMEIFWNEIQYVLSNFLCPLQVSWKFRILLQSSLVCQNAWSYWELLFQIYLRMMEYGWGGNQRSVIEPSMKFRKLTHGRNSVENSVILWLKSVNWFLEFLNQLRYNSASSVDLFFSHPKCFSFFFLAWIHDGAMDGCLGVLVRIILFCLVF